MSDNLLQGLGTQVAQSVRGVLMSGIGLGQKARDIAQSIGQALGSAVQRAVTVARNGIYNTFRSAFGNELQQDEEAIGWIWTAQHDATTCAACLAMDGSQHDISETLDSHVNCRCQMTPYYADDVPERQTGEQWFDEQNADTQKAILGPGLYDLYSNGDITLQDVVAHKYDAMYGKSIAVKPLKQLVNV